MSILGTFILAPIFALALLQAQNQTEQPLDVDAAIQAASAARNPEALETQAAALAAQHLYDPAQKLLDAALSLRAQVSGDQSAEYGLCLLKLGDLEHRMAHSKEIAQEITAYYTRAIRLLPGRPETAHAFLFLGITNLGNAKRATEYLQKAQSLDASLIGPALMWTGCMYERQKKVDDAEGNYKAALAAEKPDSIEALETRKIYERFLKDHNREDEAKALEAVPNTVRIPQLTLPATAQPPAESTKPYRIGGPVTAPAVLSKQEPSYTEEARVAKISGAVLMQVVVGADGQAHNLKVVRALGFGLDESAMSTVTKWVFKPGQRDGSPVAVYATIEVNFRLL